MCVCACVCELLLLSLVHFYDAIYILRFYCTPTQLFLCIPKKLMVTQFSVRTTSLFQFVDSTFPIISWQEETFLNFLKQAHYSLFVIQ